MSAYLAGEARVGDRFEIRGPGGRSFSWHVEDGGPLLLVAGGAGLVPLRAMLRHRLAQGADIETRLVLSVRSEPTSCSTATSWRRGRRRACGSHVTFTRSGPERRVDAALLAEAGPPAAASPHVFVCGSTAFVETAATLLLRAGHDQERVRTERFGGAA